jgi:ferric-dicitrate binding protein FerR (iron transport regulator)
MTGPTHPIPPELLTGLQNSDDRLFEQGFRELFPILVQKTAGELDDPSAATRVVEQAFVRIWEGRADIRSADALDVAMRNALHDGVVRARSRRVALHRFERNEGVTHGSPRDTPAAAPDMDQAWTRIRRALHPDDQAAAAAHAERGVQAKHRAAAHMSDAVGRDTSWKVPAAIFLGIIVVGAGGYGVWRITRPSRETVIQRSLASPDAQMLTANNGLIGKVTMADQTIVKLGAGSQLRVSKAFPAPLRAVSLNGTASFVVAPAAEVPFELRANGVAMSLSAGKIDVRSDSLAPTLVRVPNGQVRVKVGDSSWTAASGQSFVVETNGKIRVPTSLEIDDALGWIDGQFAATGSVKDVVAKVNRWYGTNLGIGDASIAARPASAAGSLDSVKATIKTLEKSSKVQMVWTKGRMMLFPAGR